MTCRYLDCLHGIREVASTRYLQKKQYESRSTFSGFADGQKQYIWQMSVITSVGRPLRSIHMHISLHQFVTAVYKTMRRPDCDGEQQQSARWPTPFSSSLCQSCCYGMIDEPERFDEHGKNIIIVRRYLFILILFHTALNVARLRGSPLMYGGKPSGWVARSGHASSIQLFVALAFVLLPHHPSASLHHPTSVCVCFLVRILLGHTFCSTVQNNVRQVGLFAAQDHCSAARFRRSGDGNPDLCPWSGRYR